MNRNLIPTLALLAGSLLGCAADRPSEPKTPAPAPHGAVPTPAHLRWHAEQFYAFVHFNMNTFTGVEWGHGTEAPESFHPTEFDANQWCSLFKECGLTGVIITAKHHDGFCLWPSAFTEHDVASSTWRGGDGDVIAELAEACRAHDLFLGIYISPWDRNNPIYGKDDEAYNAYFIGQMEELLGNYGEVAEVWWDGANGDRDNPDKHQEYDWPAFNATVARLQPDAVTFGPPYANMPIGARWVGNERGYANATQWSTYPIDVPERAGELNIGVEGAAEWFPAESDVSIRPGWYWTEESDDEVKSVDQLLDIYYNSVGHNTNLLLNFPVDDRGLVHENDAAALRAMTDVLKMTFETDLAEGQPVRASNTRGDDPFFAASRATDGDRSTYWAADDSQLTASLTVNFDQPRTIDRVVLQEYVELGQRIRAWNLEALVDGDWIPVFAGTTVGYKRIARIDPVTTGALRLNITDSRACPTLASLGAFVSPAKVAITPQSRVFLDSTTVELASDLPDTTIHYTLDGSPPTLASMRYEGPIDIATSLTLRAAAARGGQLSPLTAQVDLVAHSSATLRPSVAFIRPPDSGIRVERFEEGWQTLDQMVQRKPLSSGICAQIDPAQLTRPEHSALAFQGFIQVPADGIYEFFTSSDDGSRLYLGEERIVENDGLHGMVEAGGHVGLRAGYHPIRVEYFNASGAAGLQVRWSGPGVPKQPIAPDVLFH